MRPDLVTPLWVRVLDQMVSTPIYMVGLAIFLVLLLREAEAAWTDWWTGRSASLDDWRRLP